MTKKPVASSDPKTVSLADVIWEEIKDKQLEMFALPKQFVHMYCNPIPIDPGAKLYLTYTVPAALPALETALAGKYNVERVDKYICVSPVK
jgi:hypothetical protein